MSRHGQLRVLIFMTQALTTLVVHSCVLIPSWISRLSNYILGSSHSESTLVSRPPSPLDASDVQLFSCSKQAERMDCGSHRKFLPPTTCGNFSCNIFSTTGYTCHTESRLVASHSLCHQGLKQSLSQSLHSVRWGSSLRYAPADFYL